MKYNKKKYSAQNLDPMDDRGQKSKQFDLWRSEFLSYIESEDLSSIASFIKRNRISRGLDFFLMSMMPLVNSLYGDDVYNEVSQIIENASPIIRDKINE